MTIEHHPLADLLPALTEQEYADLKESIARNGQRRPIVMIGNRVLTGRHRLQACQELGITPQIRQYDPQSDGPLPVEYVLDEEIHRRHMNLDQRAVTAAKLYEALKDEQASTVPLKADANTLPKAAPSETAEPQSDATEDHNQPPEETGDETSEPDGATSQDPHSGQTANEEDGFGKKDKQGLTPAMQELMDKLNIGRDKLKGAMKLQQHDPELLERVGSGELSLDEALDKLARKQGATQYRQEAADLAAADHGEDIADQIRDCELLYPDRDLKAFMACELKAQQEVLATIQETKWTARQAIQFLSAAFTGSDRLSDLLDWGDWEMSRTGKKRATFVTQGRKITIEESTK